MKDHLQRDANAGDPYACLGVAYYCFTGKDREQDVGAAIGWYERAAAGKCPRAHWELAKIYRDGEYVERDLKHYMEHLAAAAELGNPEAQMALADEYRAGEVVERDDVLAFSWYRAAAENGESRAKFMVGYSYAHGIGTDVSEGDSEMWFASAGMTGDAELFLQLGLCFEYGLQGIEVNPIEAGRWYKYGVDMGHEKCTICWSSLLGEMYGSTGDTYDVRMYKLNSSNTQKEASLRDSALGIADECFDAGDEDNAFEYYQRAADLGSPIAMFNVAMMHHWGIHVKRNDMRAYELLVRAASAGSEDAQFYLARMYDDGKLPKDENEAIRYYVKAAVNGFLPALYYLSKYFDHPEVYVRRSRTR